MPCLTGGGLANDIANTATSAEREKRSRVRARAVGWGGALQPAVGRTTGKEEAPDRRARSPSHKNVKRRHGRMPTTPAHTALEGRPERARGGRRANLSRRAPLQKTKRLVRTGFGMDTGNDPSAGSPTETLLRLLLPLNNKVWTASRSVASGEPNASPQSGGLTGSFNR